MSYYVNNTYPIYSGTPGHTIQFSRGPDDSFRLAPVQQASVPAYTATYTQAQTYPQTYPQAAPAYCATPSYTPPPAYRS